MRIVPLFRDEIILYEYAPQYRTIKYGRLSYHNDFIGGYKQVKFPYLQFAFIKKTTVYGDYLYKFYMSSTKLPFDSENNIYYDIFTHNSICLGDWSAWNNDISAYITRFWNTSFTELFIDINFEKKLDILSRTKAPKNLSDIYLKSSWYDENRYKIESEIVTEEEESMLLTHFPGAIYWLKNPRETTKRMARAWGVHLQTTCE